MREGVTPVREPFSDRHIWLDDSEDLAGVLCFIERRACMALGMLHGRDQSRRWRLEKDGWMLLHDLRGRISRVRVLHLLKGRAVGVVANQCV